MASSGYSVLNDIDEIFFMCPICLEQYREPKLLPCLHRFCVNCLDQLIKENQGVNVMRCTVCREEIQIPQEGVEGFKTDFHMKNIIEYIRLQKSLQDKHYFGGAEKAFSLTSEMVGNRPERYSKGEWQISDIASHTNGGLIIAGFSKELRQTCIDIISKENKVIFEKTDSHKGVADIDDRFVASMSSEELVTGCGRKIQVIRTPHFIILSTYTLNRGPVTCLGVSSSKSIIYVGRIDSSDLLALGKDMKLHQTISIHTDKIYRAIDVAAFNDKILVCSASGTLMLYGHVTMVDVTSNQTIAEYRTIMSNHFCPKSVVLKEDTNSLLILWSSTSVSGYDTEFEYHITYHSLDVGKEHCQALIILTESARKIAATRDNKLAILDSDGDITITDIADFFTSDNLIKSLSELLHGEDCIKLYKYFEIIEEQAAKLFTGRKSGRSLLNALEEKGIIKKTNVIRLREAFARLNMPNALQLVEGYMNKTNTNSLEVQDFLSQKGGSIGIGNLGVELFLQPNSFYGDSTSHLIEMRIIPRSIFNEPAKSFTEDSSVIVELLPNNLRLKNPAVLILPHCLVLRDCKKCKVQIFTSHHAKGENPVWEEITASTRYTLTESHCKIWLQMFCWVKYKIGDEEVEAKKLVVYTAGSKYKPNAKRVTIDVGYYLDLAGENERFLEKCKQDQLIGCRKSFMFRRVPKDDLCITFTKAVPQTWTYEEEAEEEEKIPYSEIESSCEESCFFVFIKRQGGDAGLPHCTFSVSQGERKKKLYIDMEHEALEMSTPSDEQEKLHSQKYGHRNLRAAVSTSVRGKHGGDHSMVHPRPKTSPIRSKRGTDGSTEDRPISHYSRELSHYSREMGESAAPSFSQMQPVPQYQAIPFRASSVNQFPYQDSHLSSEMAHLSLRPPISGQYPKYMTSGVPYHSWRDQPSSLVFGDPSLQQETFPISRTEMNELELQLGATDDAFNRDWRLFADYLGYTHKDIMYLKGKLQPTIAVLNDAFMKGRFKTRDDLIQILKKMERTDVVESLSKYKEDTGTNENS